MWKVQRLVLLLSVLATRQAADGLATRSPHVRFVSPLLEYGFPPAVTEYASGTYRDKPLLLYLPGFDGTFLCPFLQFPELDTIFDVRCMTVGVEDRSTIDDLKEDVLAFIRKETTFEDETSTISQNSTASPSPKGTKRKPVKRRPFYIAGESFGGILACDVALELLQDKRYAFEGLTLINPATCYYRSRLAMDGPVVAASNPWLYFFQVPRLLPLFTDDYSLDQLLMIFSGEALPSVIDDELREAYLGRVAFSLPFVVPVMKQGTLKWRLTEWLEKGSARSEEKLLQLAEDNSLRILLVVGEKDRALPSIDEAERLAGILQPTQLDIHVVEGAGHASTCGSRVDLAALFRNTFPRLRRRRRVLPPSTAAVLSEPKSSSPWWQPWGKSNKHNNREAMRSGAPRTSMKPLAAAGKGKYLGMEPRYDNATIGLSPFKYWSSAYYQPLSKQSSGLSLLKVDPSQSM